jgi:hypothetical protein
MRDINLKGDNIALVGGCFNKGMEATCPCTLSPHPEEILALPPLPNRPLFAMPGMKLPPSLYIYCLNMPDGQGRGKVHFRIIPNYSIARFSAILDGRLALFLSHEYRGE